MNMNEAVEQPQDRLAIVFPLEPTPGALGVVVPENRTGELRALENERQLRVWRVRGISRTRGYLQARVFLQSLAIEPDYPTGASESVDADVP